MKYALCFVVILLFSLAQAFALTPKEITLKNGIPLIYIENQRTPVVTHMVWYRVGASQDPVGKEGLAHYVEHLMFKGTETYEAKAFSNFVSSVGGHDNAFTSWDYTAYFQTVPSAHLEKVMMMEADRLRNLRFTQQEFETERNVILAERAQVVEQNAVSRLREAMQLALYPQQPYARPIIGLPDTINAITFEDARSFYEAHYKPENVFIVISGAVTEADATALAETHYGSLPVAKAADKVVAPPFKIPDFNGAFQHVVSLAAADVPAPTLLRQYSLPNVDRRSVSDRAAFDALAMILGGTPSSRLAQTAIDNKRIATHVDVTFNETLLASSHFSLFATGQSPDFDHRAVAELLEKALHAIANKGVSADELNEAKALLKADFLYSLDRHSAPAFIFGQLYAVGVSLDRYRDYATVVDDLTVDALQLAARSIIRTASVTGILSPLPAEETTP